MDSLETIDRAKEAQKALSRFSNYGGHTDADDLFIQCLLYDHRTLQQNQVRLFFKVIESMAECKFYDDRNKASVEICKEIIEGFKATHGGNLPSQYLPFI